MGNTFTSQGDRYYQVDAVQQITTSLRDGGRGQVLMACGTGKTRVCQRSAALLCPPGGVVAVVCPTVALIVQTVQEWAKLGTGDTVLAVAGDDTIADSFYRISDIPCPVTTDPARVAAWLSETSVVATMRVIVGTHLSAHVIGEALRQQGVVAELLIVDEAHHSAGRVDKHIALVHDDAKLPARRRLYATATARIIKGSSSRSGEAAATVGMDDEHVFGPVLARYPFSQGIADGYLNDYRLAVIGVTSAETLALLRQATNTNSHTGPSPALRTAAVHAVLARAAREFDLQRVLVFCPRVRDARAFARTLPQTLATLPDEGQPARPLYASYVHGRMASTEWERRLARLAHPPDQGWTVLANARCLSEGVDVPALDGALFTHRKESTIDIVQAVGRVLRRNPDSDGISTIIIPILLADTGDVDDPVDPADFDVLWQVVRALRAHDDVFATDLDRCRANGYARDNPLSRVIVSLPGGFDDGRLLRDLTVKIVQSATSSWWDGFAELRRYQQEHGHLYPPPNDPLYTWVTYTRTRYNKGLVPADRIEALQALGFDFDPLATRWAANFAEVTAFHAAHGHIRIPDGQPGAQWLGDQRRMWRQGRLAATREAALTDLGINWSPPIGRPRWTQRLQALQAFRAIHGHLDIRYRGDNPSEVNALARVLVRLRADRRAGKLPQDRIDILNELGMDWNPVRGTRAGPGAANVE